MAKVNTINKNFKVYFHYDSIELEEGTEVYTGDTICKIYNEDGTIQLAYGHSSCAPEDQFNKREGRKISLTRAMKQLKLNREDRVVFWKTLFPQYFRS